MPSSAGSIDSWRAFIAELYAANGSRSIVEFSAQLGVAPGIAASWLRGARGVSIRTLRQIQPQIGVPMRDLLVHAGICGPSDFSAGAEPDPEAMIRSDHRLAPRDRIILATLYRRLLADGGSAGN